MIYSIICFLYACGLTVRFISAIVQDKYGNALLTTAEILMFLYIVNHIFEGV